jgi:solute carrier family 25 aspartate/glutamate transporter 12/13
LTLNDSFRARLPQKDGKIPINLQIISGAVAGASDVLITNPFEMVKVRMQLDASISTSQAVKEIGFRNLFTGIQNKQINYH